MMTIGMRIDAWISQIDSLSSTQLYGLIVAATVGLCFVLLGTGNVQDVEIPVQPTKKPKPLTGPQPRWHIFRWVNYLFIAAFLWSVFTFIANSGTYLHSDSQGVLLQFLVGWSVFLCYFFGFFGISLVHDITEEEEDTMAAATPSTKALSSSSSLSSSSMVSSKHK